MENYLEPDDLDYEIYLFVSCKHILKEAEPVCCFGDENFDNEIRYCNLVKFRNEVERLALSSETFISKLKKFKDTNFENTIDIIIVRFMKLLIEQLDVDTNIFEDKRSICYKFNLKKNWRL